MVARGSGLNWNQQPSETHTVSKMHWRQFVPEIHYVPKHIKILFISKLLSER